MKSFKKNIVMGMVAAMFMVVAAAGLAVAEDSITGTIAEKSGVMVLDAADGSYILEGTDMAPDMVGKKVKVTGMVAEDGDMKVISVLTMEEVTD